MSDFHDRKEIRREKRLAYLGTNKPMCVACGYDKHPAALERAHIAPRGFYPETALLCRNCHREQSDAEKDHAYRPETPNPTLETIGHYLLGLAEFLKLIARTLETFGLWLIDCAKRLIDPQPEAA